MIHPRITNKTFKRSLWFIAALQIGDLFTTFVFLSKGFSEGNPLWKGVMENNFSYMIIIKLLVLLLMVFLLNQVYKGTYWSSETIKKNVVWKKFDYSLNLIIIIQLFIVLYNTVGIIVM